MGMHGNRKAPFSEINVTPLVDVMLVLLVIFMIAAPLMFNGIKLDLPKTREVNPINLNTEQVILSMSKTRDYFIGKEKVLETELIDFLKKALGETKTSTVFLRADYMLRYGEVAKLMSFLKAGGISKIALVTQIEDSSDTLNKGSQ